MSWNKCCECCRRGRSHLRSIFAASVLFDRGAGVFAILLGVLLVFVVMKPADSFLLPRDLFPLSWIYPDATSMKASIKPRR
jgi:hypothetical protein